MKKDNENNLRYKEDEAMAAPDKTIGSGEGPTPESTPTSKRPSEPTALVELLPIELLLRGLSLTGLYTGLSERVVPTELLPPKVLVLSITVPLPAKPVSRTTEVWVASITRPEVL